MRLATRRRRSPSRRGDTQVALSRRRETSYPRPTVRSWVALALLTCVIASADATERRPLVVRVERSPVEIDRKQANDESPDAVRPAAEILPAPTGEHPTRSPSPRRAAVPAPQATAIRATEPGIFPQQAPADPASAVRREAGGGSAQLRSPAVVVNSPAVNRPAENPGEPRGGSISGGIVTRVNRSPLEVAPQQREASIMPSSRFEAAVGTGLATRPAPIVLPAERTMAGTTAIADGEPRAAPVVPSVVASPRGRAERSTTGTKQTETPRSKGLVKAADRTPTEIKPRREVRTPRSIVVRPPVLAPPSPTASTTAEPEVPAATVGAPVVAAPRRAARPLAASSQTEPNSDPVSPPVVVVDLARSPATGKPEKPESQAASAPKVVKVGQSPVDLKVEHQVPLAPIETPLAERSSRATQQASPPSSGHALVRPAPVVRLRPAVADKTGEAEPDLPPLNRVAFDRVHGRLVRRRPEATAGRSASDTGGELASKLKGFLAAAPVPTVTPPAALAASKVQPKPDKPAPRAPLGSFVSVAPDSPDLAAVREEFTRQKKQALAEFLGSKPVVVTSPPPLASEDDPLLLADAAQPPSTAPPNQEPAGGETQRPPFELNPREPAQPPPAEGEPEEIEEGFKPIGLVRADIATSGEVPHDYAAPRFEEEGEFVHTMGFSRAEMESFVLWEAPAVCHRPLYFEQINAERHGYSIGLFQPAFSAAHFFGRIPALPYLLVADRHHQCTYTLGHYRPGSFAPYKLHRPRFSVTGLALEATAIVGGLYALP